MARAQTTAKKGRPTTSAKGRRESTTPRPTRPRTNDDSARKDEAAQEARRKATAPTFDERSERDARSRRAGLGFRDDDGT